MGEYVWYECLLDCGCVKRQDDFKPQPPKVGGSKWCESHQVLTSVKKVNRHSIPLEEYQDMLSQGFSEFA